MCVYINIYIFPVSLKITQPFYFLLKVLEFFHFACTSEDINNLSHAMMLKDALQNVILPVIDDLIKAISNMAKETASIPMLSRTHGQVKGYSLHVSD